MSSSLISERAETVCSQCGGLLRFSYIFTLKECRPESIAVHPSPMGTLRLCPGHPKPQPIVLETCYLCGAEHAQQECIVCERIVCQECLPKNIEPGDPVICSGCDQITPDRKQARQHYWIRQDLKS